MTKKTIRALLLVFLATSHVVLANNSSLTKAVKGGMSEAKEDAERFTTSGDANTLHGLSATVNADSEMAFAQVTPFDMEMIWNAPFKVTSTTSAVFTGELSLDAKEDGGYFSLFDGKMFGGGFGSGPDPDPSLAWEFFGQLGGPEIELISVDFISDHNKMVNNNEDWTDNSEDFLEPEWTKEGANEPISHTKNQDLFLKVSVKVSPANLIFNLIGTGTGDLKLKGFAEKSTGVPQEVLVSCTLPDNVDVLSESIEWTVEVDGRPFPAGPSGPHKMYITYSTPTGTGFTEKRIAYVCGKAKDLSDKNECAKAVFDSLDQDFVFTSDSPSPIWLLHNEGQTSACPGLADFVNVHFQMLGLGAGELLFCQASPNGTYAAQDKDNYVEDLTRVVTTLPDDHPDEHSELEDKESFVHLDGKNNPNQYEATILFNGKYYACGEGIYDTPKEVCQDIFAWIGWVYTDPVTGFLKRCPFDVVYDSANNNEEEE